MTFHVAQLILWLYQYEYTNCFFFVFFIKILLLSFHSYLFTQVFWAPYMGCPRGVMVKAMNCGIVVREFIPQSRYYVYFRANTLGKGMNPLILPPAMGK